MSLYAEPTEDVAFTADALVSGCIESGSRALLLDGPSTPAEFFDLSTRVAGELLRGLSKYSLRLAVVVPDLSVHSPSFQAFARESNRGSQFRFFETRSEAVEWLESFAQT